MTHDKKRVLVVGSGGREHALARAIARTAEVIVAPGNAGIAPPLQAVPLGKRGDDEAAKVRAAVELAKREAVDLVVVGPEAPLCEGLVDALSDAGVLAFGPSKAAARLEGSKAFLKTLAKKYEIPTADFDIVTSLADAEAVIRRRGAPIVVKASGLCAGKGVVVATTVDEAIDAARAMLDRRVFGEAGATVVIEECLRGVEASVHVVTDGEKCFFLPVARDHKRVFDGDRGPNTGGMGVIAPNPAVTPDLLSQVEREIVVPTLTGMKKEGAPFRGVLFAGLMITPEGKPFLLEHNVRFGDPECEALMALLDGDVTELLASAARGSLDASVVSIDASRHAAVVVLASQGYPEAPRTGDVIRGLDRAADVPGVVVNHAGTARRGEEIVTAGGRVLAVTATGATLAEARGRVYEAANRISFDGKHQRSDIGAA